MIPLARYFQLESSFSQKVCLTKFSKISNKRDVSSSREDGSSSSDFLNSKVRIKFFAKLKFFFLFITRRECENSLTHMQFFVQFPDVCLFPHTRVSHTWEFTRRKTFSALTSLVRNANIDAGIYNDCQNICDTRNPLNL